MLKSSGASQMFKVLVIAIFFMALVLARGKYAEYKNYILQQTPISKNNLSALTAQVIYYNNSETTNTAINNNADDTPKEIIEPNEELLRKYSKIYFLDENYIPKALADIDEKYALNGKYNSRFLEPVLPHLYRMLYDAESNEVNINVVSAYRSFSDQADLKALYEITYGAEAKNIIANQGYSEHQLGTAVDLSVKKTNATTTQEQSTPFEKTPAYKWLVENAYRYGFIISYPEGNKHFQFEPWHWRFIGIRLAKKLHDEKINFYDLDQHVINEYLASFFD